MRYLIYICTFFFGFQSSASDSLIQNMTYKQGLTKAIEEQKILVVKIDADWCKPCKELTAEFESNQEFRSVIERSAILIRLDLRDESGKEFLLDKGVHSYPSVFMENPSQEGYLEFIGKQPISNYLSGVKDLADPDNNDLNKWKKLLASGIANESEILAYSKELKRFHLNPDELILQFFSEFDFRNTTALEVEIFNINYSREVDALHRSAILNHLQGWNVINAIDSKALFNKICLYVYRDAARVNNKDILNSFIDENIELIILMTGSSDRKRALEYIEDLVEHAYG